jgi:3-oxoacyl-[acyl-carrier-protein] synthase II
MNDRLWVTGLGLMTPLGADVESTWTRLVRGDRAIRPVTLFDATSQRVGIAAEVDGVSIPDGPGDVRGAWSRTSVMATSAAGEAIRMAGLDVGKDRVGLVVGGTTGGMFETEQILARLHGEPSCRHALSEMLSHPLTATGDRLDERLGPFARIRTLSSACSSGANAVVCGAGWLLLGDLDAVLVGGSDGLCRLTLSGFNALSAIDPEPCRPFDRRRRGTSLGEGAGFLVLERAPRARARGARPVAELAGWALGAEAHHITHPAPDGVAVASLISRALAHAGVSPEELDYVNAHGTGTAVNDPIEAAALARALGREIARVPVSSSKGQLGHTLGAAGAIEAVITALVVSRHTLVPTAGLDEPDPAIALVHVPQVGREVRRVRAALSNAFGFGGMDTVLVFAEPHATRVPVARHVSAGPIAGRRSGTVDPEVVITGVAAFGPWGRLGAAECATIPESGHPSAGSADPERHLDLARARRLDAASRLGAVAVEHVLQQSQAPREDTGTVLGSVFGSVDGSAAFMHRIFEKGARAASPADFPNLVPSSPVGHVAIYAGLRGAAFATADLSMSGESATVAAIELVAAGEAPRVVAGVAEPRSRIGEGVLSALFSDRPDDGSSATAARVDLATAILVEAGKGARGRAAPILARVAQVVEWRDDGPAALMSLDGPHGPRPEVVLARPSPAADALLGGTGWRGCPRLSCAQSVGESDGLGGLAVAVAAARIGRGVATEALVLGLGGHRGVAIVLTLATLTRD